MRIAKVCISSHLSLFYVGKKMEDVQTDVSTLLFECKGTEIEWHDHTT